MAITLDDDDYTVGTEKTFRVTVASTNITSTTPLCILSSDRMQRTIQKSGTLATAASGTFTFALVKTDVFPVGGRYHLRVFTRHNGTLNITDRGENDIWVDYGPGAA